jgi:hypothetical protein
VILGPGGRDPEHARGFIGHGTNQIAEIVAAMRPRWAAEAAQAHRQIAAIKLRRAGEKVSEAITRANFVK